MNKEQMLQLLRKDVVPALGCTEPVCVALCAATAGTAMTGPVKTVTMEVNSGIYKNAMSAGIPNCTKVGIPWAAAIGIHLKNPEKSLELLADITPEVLEKASSLVESGSSTVVLNAGEAGLYVRCTARSETEEVVCLIRGAHTNVVFLSRNGEVLLEKQAATAASGEDELVRDLTGMTIAGMVDLVRSASEEELSFLEDGIRMNDALAGWSLEHPVGVGLADSLHTPGAEALLKENLMSRILWKVTSAAESRLDGCPLPTMSSSGAGTKGLVVILPISETASYIGASRQETLRAVALGHLVNRYMNAQVGKLSPMCSCVMCSSTAASAGITYLLGGNGEQIGHAIRNMAGTVTGMICDGGKVGCALKVATGSFAALTSAIHAVNGAVLRVSDGICAETAEDCIRNMAAIGNNGMKDTNREILRIMTEA